MPSTTRYRRGDLVLVPFPVTDLSSSKRRPALVVSPDTFNERTPDLVLVAISSQRTDDRRLTIECEDCIDGMLPKASVMKPAKLFMIHSTLVRKQICALRPDKLQAVLTSIRQLLS